MFSRSCQYAIQAVLFIALHQKDNKLVGLKTISESQEIPLHFLGKILQNLARHKILVSTKGPNGGFGLYSPANKMTLLEIVKLVDGLDIFDRCGIGLKTCSDKNPCPIHNDYKIVKNKIKTILSEKTVSELIQDVEAGKSIVNFIG